MNFFISNIEAATTATNNGMHSKDNIISLFVMILIFGIICYFIIIKPQNKKNKEKRELINSLSNGDEILTTGGIIGKIVKISDCGYITILINKNNQIIIKKDFVIAIVPKGTIKKLFS
ncbi:preprotein translocase subunit YajC [Enterobacteriaceae endosymbiont of Plateumaris consimilis]|uniref:preprotein translocase subunit YajC n=1 Tax=Enterobacteriaceae endosymbiont of Plateumaris consimilis TaxID=2675794 RepID=UPI001448BEB8|nr:preprotein translocase subunit YajC [Enterobacteriaceae endosymbiont of Plateumaris consimilis]QJC28571.1 preprotein translocase subunit YajC [Enterobacteriaceae endosymbiont of Plateumaris consimilis]